MTEIIFHELRSKYMRKQAVWLTYLCFGSPFNTWVPPKETKYLQRHPPEGCCPMNLQWLFYLVLRSPTGKCFCSSNSVGFLGLCLGYLYIFSDLRDSFVHFTSNVKQSSSKKISFARFLTSTLELEKTQIFQS